MGARNDRVSAAFFFRHEFYSAVKTAGLAADILVIFLGRLVIMDVGVVTDVL